MILLILLLVFVAALTAAIVLWWPGPPSEADQLAEPEARPAPAIPPRHQLHKAGPDDLNRRRS